MHTFYLQQIAWLNYVFVYTRYMVKKGGGTLIVFIQGDYKNCR